jgi:tetratricopeptide (TPR) repeat protein/predicted Ser/Thr protein kinase
MIGRQLGRYRVVSRIGAGGMGEVYLGEDTRLNRPVAIKVLAGDDEFGASDRKQLEREAAAMSRLNHPNIATVYDFNHVDDLDYLVMEYVEGETLADRLRHGELSEKEVRRWGGQIAEALAEAHALGVLHRDIKPQNIMITQQGQAKVLDFGLAKLSRSERSIASTMTATADGSVLGTIPYMAPESLAGKPATARSDIFALGAVLYEMATGRRAFRADTSPQLIDRILHEEPPAVTALNRQMSPGLERCIEKCLDKEPERRYQAVREVSVDLQRLGEVETTGSRPIGVAARPKRRWWRLAAPAIPLVAAAVWALIWFGSAEPALSFAARDWILLANFENQTGDTRYDAAIQTAFLTSLEQSTHANIYPRTRVTAVLRRMGRENDLPVDEELGREICVRANIRGLVTASIGRVGQQFALSAQLIDPATGERVRSYVEHANGEDEILETLESISKALRRDLGESLASIHRHNAPLLEITTPSLDALRLFAEGLEAWRRIKPDLAMELLGQALELDPDFAMAHAALGAHYYSHIYNDSENGEYHYRRALELVDRVTERERRLIETEFASHRDHLDEASRLYRTYLTLYPDDLSMHQGFAKLLMSNNFHKEAAAVYVEVLRIEPDDASANINFGVCQAELGNSEGALASYEKAFEIEPTWRDWGNLNHEYGFMQVQMGRREEARDTFDHAAEVGPGNHGPHRSLGLLALFEGKIGEARQHFARAIELAQGDDKRLSQSRNYVFASLTSLCEGDLEQRVGELRRSAQLLGELGPSPAWWVRTGIELARCGEIAAAEEALRSIEEQMDPENDAHQAGLLRLQAELAVINGDIAGAIRLLDAAGLKYESPETREGIAVAYAQRGSSEEAEAALRTFIEDPSPPLGWEPQVRWQEAHVLLAAMYIDREQVELAIPLLDFILECWSEADADFDLAIEARELRGRI